MTSIPLFRPSGSSWCFRLVNADTGYVWDRTANDNAGGLVAAPTATNTSIVATYNANRVSYDMALPATLPSGRYHIVFYNVAYDAYATTDSAEGGYLITTVGNVLQGDPVVL